MKRSDIELIAKIRASGPGFRGGDVKIRVKGFSDMPIPPGVVLGSKNQRNIGQLKNFGVPTYL